MINNFIMATAINYSESQLLAMTFDDVLSMIPYHNVLEQKEINLKTACYLWYLGQYIPHLYSHQKHELLSYIIGCVTEGELREKKSGVSTLHFPNLIVSSDMRKMTSAAGSDLELYIELMRSVNPELVAILAENKPTWSKSEPTAEGVKLIEGMVSIYKHNYPGSLKSRPDGYQLADQPEDPTDNPASKAILTASIEKRLIDENDRLKELKAKNNQLRRDLRAENAELEAEQEARKRFMAERGKIEQATDETVTYKDLYEGEKEKFCSIKKAFDNIKEDMDLLKSTETSLRSEIVELRTNIATWNIPVVDSTREYQKLLFEMHEMMPFLPTYMTALSAGPFLSKIFEIGGPLGPFIGRPVSNLQEKAEILKTLWNDYIIQEIIKSGCYSSANPLMKNIKDMDTVIKDTAKTMVSEIGITSDLSDKLTKIIDYINQEKIVLASRSTKEGTLEEVSKPEAESKVAQALLATSSTSAAPSRKTESTDVSKLLSRFLK